MMRVVQIGPYPEPSGHVRGGIEASVLGLSQEQGKRAEVHVFDMPRIGGEMNVERDGLVTVHRFCNAGKRQISMSRLVKDVAKEICNLHPDVCHIHGTNLYQWLMYRELVRNGQCVAVTIHGLVLVEKRNLLKKRFTLKRFVQYLYQGTVEKRFLSNLSWVIVDTEYVRKAVKQYPIRKKPEMYVIPQGIDDSFFGMSCSETSTILLSVGAFGERKGHMLTLKAFEELRQGGVKAKLVLAGSVASKPYFDQLKRATRDSVFGEDIALYTDISDSQLKELYRTAHVFVLHSEEESQGIVFVEAMAVGLPVVSTIVGGIPYVVTDGNTGLLSVFGDIKSFTENMKKLMEDSNLWQSMSASAKRSAESYHWFVIAQKINKLYGKCLK